MAISVDTAEGLRVPLLRDVDRHGVQEPPVAQYELLKRARAGQAGLDDLPGRTCTITGIGIDG